MTAKSAAKIWEIRAQKQSLKKTFIELVWFPRVKTVADLLQSAARLNYKACVTAANRESWNTSEFRVAFLCGEAQQIRGAGFFFFFLYIKFLSHTQTLESLLL